MNECPSCHKSVSEFATMCPHCKMPLSGGANSEKNLDVDINENEISIPLYALITSAILLSFFSVVILFLVYRIETSMSLPFGDNCYTGICVVRNCCRISLAGVVQAVLLVIFSVLCVKYRNKHINFIQIYLLFSLLVMITVIIFLMVALRSPMTFVRDESIIGLIQLPLKMAPFYYGILISAFPLLSMYCFIKWGAKNGIIMAVILGAIEFFAVYVCLYVFVTVLGFGINGFHLIPSAIAVLGIQVFAVIIATLMRRRR